MAWKVGQDLLKIDVEEPSGKVTFDTYRIRTIRGIWVYATGVFPWTWGKVSKKHGDFGWKDPIDPMWRQKFRADEGPKSWSGLATTRIKALEIAIANQKAHGRDEDYEGITTNEAVIKKLQKMLLTERNKGKKKREAKAATKRQAEGVGPDQTPDPEV